MECRSFGESACRRPLVRTPAHGHATPREQRPANQKPNERVNNMSLSDEPRNPGTPIPRHADTPAPLLERIIEASARNAFLIIILAVFGIAGGIWALTKTPLDAIPDLSDR